MPIGIFLSEEWVLMALKSVKASQSLNDACWIDLQFSSPESDLSCGHEDTINTLICVKFINALKHFNSLHSNKHT